MYSVHLFKGTVCTVYICLNGLYFLCKPVYMDCVYNVHLFKWTVCTLYSVHLFKRDFMFSVHLFKRDCMYSVHLFKRDFMFSVHHFKSTVCPMYTFLKVLHLHCAVYTCWKELFVQCCTHVANWLSIDRTYFIVYYCQKVSELFKI